MNAIVADAPVRATQAEVRPEDNPESIYYRPASAAGESAPLKLPTNYPASDSPTMIRLYLRPRIGNAFPNPLDEAMTNAGLVAPRRWAPGSTVLSRPDSKEPVAWFTASPPLSPGQRQIVIAIDPSHCDLVLGAGTWLFERVKMLMARLGGARLHDGLGNRLLGRHIMGFAESIDAKLREREHEERQARTTRIDERTTREQLPLSFQHILRRFNGRGREVGHMRVDFDAPALNFERGMEHGARMALEHIEWIREHPKESYQTQRILAEAQRISVECTGLVSPANTAHGYLQIMGVLAHLGAQQIRLGWVNEEIQRHQESVARSAELDAEEKAAFVKRMKAGRDAKKAQRKGGAA